MPSDEFVNRSSELARLSDFLDADDNRNRVAIVCGTSGVGKSTVVRHVLRDQTKWIVWTKTTRSEVRTLQSGTYLRAVARAIDESAADIDSYANYREQNKWIDVGKDLVGAASSWAGLGFVPGALKKIRDRLRATGDWDWRRDLDQGQRPDLDRLRDYVGAILADMPLVLVIQNTQNMDAASRDFLTTTMEETTSKRVILEFTIDHGNREELRELKSALEDSGADVRMINVLKLPWDEVNHLIPADLPALRRHMSNMYASWDGNLVPLVDVDMLLLHGDAFPAEVISEADTGLGAITDANVSRLTPAARYVLSIVALKGGRIDRGLLADAYEATKLSAAADDLSAILGELASRRLIKNDLTMEIETRHDDIGERLLADDDFSQSTLLAANNLSAFIDRAIEEKSGSAPESLLVDLSMWRVVVASYLEDAEGSLRALDRVTRLAAHELAPEVIFSHFESLNASLRKLGMGGNENPIYDAIRYRIHDICFEHRALPIIRSILSDLQPTTVKRRILIALMHISLEEHEKALSVIEPVAKNAVDGRAGVIAGILVYIANRHLGRIELGREQWRALMAARERFRHGYEWGFVTRNAEMFEPPLACLKPVLESVAHFRALGDTVEAAHSLNSYAAQLTRLGELDRAHRLMKRAGRDLIRCHAGTGQFWNNLAVVRAKRGERGSEIIKPLERARSSLVAPFDKVSVNLNLMNAHFEDGAIEVARAFADRVETLLKNESVASPQIRKTILDALGFFATNTGDHDMADRVARQRDDLDIEADPYRARVDGDDTTPRYIMLARWYPTIGSPLARSELSDE